MGMSFINWMGFLMLLIAILLNEIFLGINTWYELNLGATVVAVMYLVVGAFLLLWPSAKDQSV